MTSLLCPQKYSSLDLVPINPTLMSNGASYFLTVVSKYWYRIYQLPQMKILLDSVVFDGKIRAISQGSNDSHIFVAVRNTIYVMKYLDCIQKIELSGCQGKISQLLVLFPVVVASIKNSLHICSNDNQQPLIFNYDIKGIIHPPTYLNKILIWTSKEIAIINIVTKKIVVQISVENLFEKLSQTYEDHEIITVECTPALDVVAISLGHVSNSLVILFNLQTFTVVQIYQTGTQVQQIGFNSQGKVPIMAFVQKNNLKLIELNKQELIYTHVQDEQIDWVRFIPNTQSVFVGSAYLNSIKEMTYDFDQPQMLTAIRERSGFQGSIDNISFIGHEDDPHGSVNIIASSNFHTAEIKWISLINENMSQKFTSKQNKQIKKETKLTEEQVGNEIPRVLNLSFSTNRSNDWSNVVTTHKNSNKPFLWNSENKSINKIKVEMHESKQEKTLNSQIVQVFVTSCGNFGLITLDDGRIVKFTMQSGSHLKTFKQTTQVNHLFVDTQNQYLIVTQESKKLLQLDFYSGKVFKEKDLDSNVSLFSHSKTSSLLLTAHYNNQIIIWDYTSMKIIRRLDGHTQKIFSAQFTYDNQHVVSSSLDSTLCVWGILNGTLIQSIKLQKPIVSLDLSPNGNLLCAAFANSRSISVFNSRLGSLYDLSRATKTLDQRFASHIETKPGDARAQVYKFSAKIEEEYQPRQQLDVEHEEDNLLSFTILEDGKWVPLQHLDQIRDRNRVKLADDDVKIPFFMDFRNIDQEKKNLLDDLKDKAKEKSKILRHEKDKFLAELESQFESLLDVKDENKLYSYLKTLSPSQFDYELRSGFLGKPQNIKKMIIKLDALFSNNKELDLKVTYLFHFLKVSQDDFDMIYDDHIEELLNSIQSSLRTNWSRIDDMKEYIECVIDYLRIRK